MFTAPLLLALTLWIAAALVFLAGFFFGALLHINAPEHDGCGCQPAGLCRRSCARATHVEPQP